MRGWTPKSSWPGSWSRSRTPGANYGDNIPEEPVNEPGPDLWRKFIGTARQWRGEVNRRGGDVTLVHLPDVGIRGNTHFMMSDLNNVRIADLLSQFLAAKKLD